MYSCDPTFDVMPPSSENAMRPRGAGKSMTNRAALTTCCCWAPSGGIDPSPSHPMRMLSHSMVHFIITTFDEPAVVESMSSFAHHACSRVYTIETSPQAPMTEKMGGSLARGLFILASPCHPNSWANPAASSARFRVICGGRERPNCLVCTLPTSPLYEYSWLSTAELNPASSEKPSPVAHPSQETQKRAALPTAVMPILHLLVERRALGELRQPEDDELGGLHRGDAHVDGQDAGVPVLLRVVLRVALDVERLFRGAAEKRSGPPHAAQEHADRAFHRPPQEFVVRLEDDPVGAAEGRVLH